MKPTKSKAVGNRMHYWLSCPGREQRVPCLYSTPSLIDMKLVKVPFNINSLLIYKYLLASTMFTTLCRLGMQPRGRIYPRRGELVEF